MLKWRRFWRELCVSLRWQSQVPNRVEIFSKKFEEGLDLEALTDKVFVRSASKAK